MYEAHVNKMHSYWNKEMYIESLRSVFNEVWDKSQ